MSVETKNRLLKKMYARHTTSDKPLTQVDRVMLLFGGAKSLCEALAAVGKPKHRFTVYRWNYSRARGGADGIIPSSAIPDIVAAARYAGILLTSEHLDPRPNMPESARELVTAEKAANEEPG